MFSFEDYDRSVLMMSVKQWLERAGSQMADPARREIIMSQDSDRARAETALAFVAAESIPYEKANRHPYFDLRIGKVLWILEKSIHDGSDPLIELRVYNGEIDAFHAATQLAR